MRFKFLFLFLLLSFAATSQPASLDWAAEDKTFTAGQSVTMRIVVASGFDSICGIQGTFMWDLAALSFDSVSAIGSDLGFQSDGFGLWNLHEGKVRFIWDDVWSKSYPAGAYAFSIHFTALVDGSLSTFAALEPKLDPYWISLQPLAYYMTYVGPPQNYELYPIPFQFSFFDEQDLVSLQAPVSAATIRVYPNPLPAGARLNVLSNTDYSVFSFDGRFISRHGAGDKSVSIRDRGTYVIRPDNAKPVIVVAQ